MILEMWTLEMWQRHGWGLPRDIWLGRWHLIILLVDSHTQRTRWLSGRSFHVLVSVHCFQMSLVALSWMYLLRKALPLPHHACLLSQDDGSLRWVLSNTWDTIQSHSICEWRQAMSSWVSPSCWQQDISHSFPMASQSIDLSSEGSTVATQLPEGPGLRNTGLNL